MQHLIVIIIFAACLYLVIRRLARIVAGARRGDPRCISCTETNCPLHRAYEESSCSCGCGETKKKGEKTDIDPKNCKKTRSEVCKYEK